ncbi:hypothetical protein AAHB45_05100 [Pediococcus pentosaceus]|uniref:Transposase n=1 Tax=Pediococcus pentosaceus TaxID=1255 RepID=A0AB73HGL8_PEDPE|nr:hypothetical protein [Pediococcus pentosaceus]KAF0466366.1 hypothetical protein GBP05_07520 [Pediococcus pentosaceus]MBF7115615.1 hypothetical protein [Pediococcus pentosaceus]MCM6793311.1 hypothetical protein [Pediococcus pentosaceus]MCM6810616.1 hypothetical protein [Pediococcus pentosaceus]MCM6817539.1 hypothetical protein [Pediococcus pentosaceus]
MADAGYGSEPSYTFIESPSKQVLIPYTKYEKEQTRKYKNNQTKIQNWDYDPRIDTYMDQHGIKYYFDSFGIRKDIYRFERKFRYYIAEEAQTPETYNCSTTPKGNPKRISINPN